MTDSEPSSINILIRLNSGIAEIKVPIEKLKIELDAILEKFQYLIKPSITTPMVEIEELQFEVAITDDGRLAVLSANVTEHDVGYTIKLRVRRTETDWKFSEPAITPAQVTQTDLVKHVPAAKQTTYPRSSGNEYSLPATAKTPALIIFLLDVSASMKQPYSEGTKKIDEISNLLQSIAVRMVQRSTKGTMVTPRYRIAMYAYSSQVIDLLGGIKTIEELAALGVPKLTTLDMSDVNAAFCEVEQLLKIELPHLQNCPAPLIYHITDGEYNGANPQPVVQRIMEMGTLDGRVLISNVTYDNEILHTIPDIDSWSGYQAREEVPTLLGQTLFEMSSMLPDRYRSVMREFGFRLGDNSRMLFPAKFKDLIEISFVMSGATPVVRKLGGYCGMSFSLESGETITLNESVYEVMANPRWPKFAFAQEGRKSLVYKLRERDMQSYWALKIFKPAFYSNGIAANTISLKKYEMISGMQICQRSVIDRREDTVDSGSALKLAVLMPWINGFSWSGIMTQKMALSKDSSLALAEALSQVLAGIEKHGEAHCDLAGENLIVDLELKQIELLDLEDMFSTNLQRPQYVPAGGDGYQHRQSRQGLWGANADRFAGAVLLAELLTWYNPKIRELAFGEQFFDPAEMQQTGSKRYRRLVQVLADLSGNAAELFDRAWNSTLLEECPKLWEWRQVIRQISDITDPVKVLKEFTDSQLLLDLHNALDSTFNLEELRTLCFKLQIDYDNLRGGVKQAKARELVLHFERRNRLAVLLEAIRQERGHIV